VAIIGGGNAAIDSARTALRKGARSPCFTGASAKICLPSKKKPKPPRRGREIRIPGRAAPGDWRRGGKVKSIEIVKTRLGEYDTSGRRKPVSTDEIRRFDCDSVIFAVGESVDLDFAKTSGLQSEGEAGRSK
jgi:NADH-quinone oxidoreductase subunit F